MSGRIHVPGQSMGLAGHLVEVKMRMSPDLARSIMTERATLERVLAEQQRMVVALVNKLGGAVEVGLSELENADPSLINVLRRQDGEVVRIEIHERDVPRETSEAPDGEESGAGSRSVTSDGLSSCGDEPAS